MEAANPHEYWGGGEWIRERAAVAGAIWGLGPVWQEGLGMLLKWGCASQKQPVGMKIALTADAEKYLRLLY